VWITKYRRPALSIPIQKRLKILIEDICEKLHLRIIKIGFEEDHVHIYVSIPVVQPIPMIMQRLKGSTSFQLNKEFRKELKQYYWNKNVLWAVGYFVATVGEVNHETIEKYVEDQGKKDIKDECVELADIQE